MDNFGRYIRQRILFGELDDKIHESKVAVIGIGGIGSWVAELLARIGVKKIILADKDIVSLSDLHRQVYTEEDIGKYKVDAMENRLRNVNSQVEIETYKKFDEGNALEIFKKVDIVFDGTDNIETRYLINEASVLTGKPWIFGTVTQFKGYAALINPEHFCFYDIFANKTPELSCDTYGVCSAAVLFVASLEIKLFLQYLEGNFEPYIYHYDLKNMILEKIKVKRNPKCKICVLRDFEYLKWI